MMPLHDTTILMLIALAVAAGIALLVAQGILQSRGWLLAAILCAIAVPLALVLPRGLDGITIGIVARAGAVLGLAVIAGAIWGALLKHSKGWIAVLLLAGPLVVAVGATLEGQRVPSAPCATSVPFQIGDLTLQVPRSMTTQSLPVDSSVPHPWQGSYSLWAGDKPDVGSLCRVSDGGRVAVPVSHLWLAKDGTPDLGVVQLYANPDGKPVPSLGQFSSDQIAAARAGGAAEGIQCGTELPDNLRFCAVWFDLTPAVIAVATAWLPAPGPGTDPVADAKALVQAEVAKLTLP